MGQTEPGRDPDGTPPVNTVWCYLNHPGYNNTLWRYYRGKRYHLTRTMSLADYPTRVAITLSEVGGLRSDGFDGRQNQHWERIRTLTSFDGPMAEADRLHGDITNNFSRYLMESLL